MDFRTFVEFLRDAAKYIITVAVVLIIIVYVFTLQQVVGNSMHPTYKDKDVVFLNKFIYRITEPKYNDVISFNYANTKYLVKRVIGVPGDYVEYKDNKLYLNGKEKKEPYLKNVTTEDFSIKDFGYDKIPKDSYLVLGDNRGDSLDSRNFGLITKKDIIGKVLIKLWPLN